LRRSENIRGAQWLVIPATEGSVKGFRPPKGARVLSGSNTARAYQHPLDKGAAFPFAKFALACISRGEKGPPVTKVAIRAGCCCCGLGLGYAAF
jgi:hypothetical protein